MKHRNWWLLFQFYILLDQIPIHILPQQIWMLCPHMVLHCFFVRYFVCFTDQAAINDSFVQWWMSSQTIFCRKCQTAILTFKIFESKMLAKMISVLPRIRVSVWTILTCIQFIIVDFHVTVQINLVLKRRLTIWFQALVPELLIGSFFMHLSM